MTAAKPGLLCLQGGDEFTAACHDMDLALLARAPGPVAVVALAAAPGEDYHQANVHGVSHFRRLGAEAFDVPDPREHEIVGVLDGVGLVVLPGGSPSRLLAGLHDTGFGKALEAHVAAGGAVLGASAGAMVLCGWTVLPEEQLGVVEGLGLAPGLAVIPHWRGPRSAWSDALAAAAPGVVVLGLPEHTGVFVDDGTITVVGGPVHQLGVEVDLRVGHTVTAPGMESSSG